MPRPKYKHMSPYETFLFDHYIGSLGRSADEYEFDFKVGVGRIPPTHLEEPYTSLSVSLSQKRIDALRRTAKGIEIIEVKADAALSALGQLLGYRLLYQQQEEPKVPVTLTVITDFVGPDEEFYYKRFQIEVATFPEASDSWRLFNLPATIR